MRPLVIAVMLIASDCLAQQPEQTITVPVGTKISIEILNPLFTETARPGDVLRAWITFPVVVTGQIAIPPGTYVDGVIDNVTKRGRKAGIRAHFMHLVFANGYTVPLSRATMEVRSDRLGASLLPTGSVAAQAALPTPVPFPGTPQSPKIDTHTGLIVGLSVAVAAGAAIALILGHGGGYLSLPAGWRTEMVLEDPVSLDRERTVSAGGAQLQ